MATLWQHLNHFQLDIQPPTPASALSRALTALTYLSLAPLRAQHAQHAASGSSSAALSPCGAGAPPIYIRFYPGPQK